MLTEFSPRLLSKVLHLACQFCGMKAEALAKSLEPLVAAGLSMSWEKDNRLWHCAYCGVRMSKNGAVEAERKTEDHVLPVCRGGKITIPACIECNRAKGPKSLPDFLASPHFREKRSLKARRMSWPEHELLAVYAVAILRRTHEQMMEAGKSQPQKPATKAAVTKTPATKAPAAKPSVPQPAGKIVHAPFPPEFLRCTLKT